MKPDIFVHSFNWHWGFLQYKTKYNDSLDILSCDQSKSFTSGKILQVIYKCCFFSLFICITNGITLINSNIYHLLIDLSQYSIWIKYDIFTLLDFNLFMYMIIIKWNFISILVLNFRFFHYHLFTFAIFVNQYFLLIGICEQIYIYICKNTFL